MKSLYMHKHPNTLKVYIFTFYYFFIKVLILLNCETGNNTLYMHRDVRTFM
jgi:hypothetical protein